MKIFFRRIIFYILMIAPGYLLAFDEIKMLSLEELYAVSDVIAIVEIKSGEKSGGRFVVSSKQDYSVKGGCKNSECIIRFSHEYAYELPVSIGSLYLVHLEKSGNDGYRLVRFPFPAIKVLNVVYDRPDIELVIENLGVEGSYVVHEDLLWFAEECAYNSKRIMCDEHMKILNAFFERHESQRK